MYMYVCVCICMYVCVYIYIYVSLSAVAGFNSTKVQILTLKALVEPAAKKRGWALPGQLLRSIDSGGERERGGCHALEGGTFAKHGNVGQVELHEAKDADNKDDFKNYGINIKGRFRAKQDLQLLNSNVQSGGEKSLSIPSLGNRGEREGGRGGGGGSGGGGGGGGGHALGGGGGKEYN